MGKAGAVEAVLVDRIGDQRRGAAVTDIGDGGVDRADDSRRIRRIGMACPPAQRGADRRDRQGFAEN